MFRLLTTCLVAALAVAAHGHELDRGEVRYIANAGVLVSDNDTQIMFDPLFRNTFDRYDPVADAVRATSAGGTGRASCTGGCAASPAARPCV